MSYKNVHYHQSNLSCFKLTARPKERTVEMKFAVAIACNSAITSIEYPGA